MCTDVVDGRVGRDGQLRPHVRIRIEGDGHETRLLEHRLGASLRPGLIADPLDADPGLLDELDPVKLEPCIVAIPFSQR